ncbi:Por secretion system C-terminal sorting domain-containing protein [Chitinophaga jiangningensis]|uniref:Por secretion system C-terminal sorting domain-containing protein n=2 Tax=Chitinophaga jiangningensis TaxID=1419482 RepID=A0A1M7N4D4_9BACT|nr:Por secretion system C-terminal sorting domain-containing protein [Chitinophaga jiangningensis]
MKALLITLAGVLLHVASAHAAAHCSRQGVDSTQLRAHAVRVFPNPAVSQWNIEGIRNMKQLALYSIAGQLIRQWPVNGKQSQLLTPDLSHGTYLLRVSFDDGSSASKIILKQ